MLATNYDDLGLASETNRTYTGLPQKRFIYTYFDGSRNTMTVKDSSGTTLLGRWTYGYDKNGRCTSVHSPADVSGTGLTVSYFDNGLENRRTLPNGLYTDTTWNGLNLPLSHKNWNAAGTTKLNDFGTFIYDGAFNMTQLVAASDQSIQQIKGTTTWQYDTKDRLTQEQSSRGFSSTGNQYTLGFGYDGAGNPTTMRGVTQSFDSDNKLSATGYSYDGNGSPTTYAGSTVGYDQENRLTSIDTSSGDHFKAGYTAGGLRAWKSSLSNQQAGEASIPVTNRTYFVYDGSVPVLETDSSGGLKAVNVFAPDGLVARGTVSSGSTSYKYYSFDPQGSVSVRSNSTGGVTQNALYDAYGKQIQVPSPSGVTDSWGWNGRWGYYADVETGLILCTYRYYDANQGRWLTRDPIGYAGGVNLYGYCGSGPLNSMDALGLAVTILGFEFSIEGFVEGLQTSGLALARGFWRGIDSVVELGTYRLLRPNTVSMLDEYKDRPGIDASEALWGVAAVALDGACVLTEVESLTGAYGTFEAYRRRGSLGGFNWYRGSNPQTDRVFGLDWHPNPDGPPPHLDIPPWNVKHWPWSTLKKSL